MADVSVAQARCAGTRSSRGSRLLTRRFFPGTICWAQRPTWREWPRRRCAEGAHPGVQGARRARGGTACVVNPCAAGVHACAHVAHDRAACTICAVRTYPQPNGYGVYSWPDSSRYEGDWHDGLKHGRGTYTWPRHGAQPQLGCRSRLAAGAHPHARAVRPRAEQRRDVQGRLEHRAHAWPGDLQRKGRNALRGQLGKRPQERPRCARRGPVRGAPCARLTRPYTRRQQALPKRRHLPGLVAQRAAERPGYV